MRTLWLVRHATPLIAPGTCYGRLDIPADEADTETAADALATILPPQAALVSSPLLRCRQLADALVHRRPGRLLRQDPRLAEMHFGTWEGRLWADLGAAALDAWAADFAHHAPGGGDTVQGFVDRIAEVVDELPDGDTVWISHAGVIRAAGLVAEGRRRIVAASDWPSAPVAFGGCIRLPMPGRAPSG
ncbi:phosphoglycerate kinase [Xylophilus sp. Kf1]|nr:phosphoglycerate kinase [Xylophilus sp. Kf1]